MCVGSGGPAVKIYGDVLYVANSRGSEGPMDVHVLPWHCLRLFLPREWPTGISVVEPFVAISGGESEPVVSSPPCACLLSHSTTAVDERVLAIL